MSPAERNERMKELITILHKDLIPYNPPPRDYSWLKVRRPDLHDALEEYLKLKKEEECDK